MKSILVLLFVLVLASVEAKPPVINEIDDFPKPFVSELQRLDKQELPQEEIQRQLEVLLNKYEIHPHDRRKLLWFDLTIGEILLNTITALVDLATPDDGDEAVAAERTFEEEREAGGGGSTGNAAKAEETAEMEQDGKMSMNRGHGGEGGTRRVRRGLKTVKSLKV